MICFKIVLFNGNGGVEGVGWGVAFGVLHVRRLSRKERTQNQTSTQMSKFFVFSVLLVDKFF